MVFEKVASAKPAAGDAFEDVLYGSESELDDSDDEHRAIPIRKGKDPVYGTRLRADDEEPMDLLQGVASRITSIPFNGMIVIMSHPTNLHRLCIGSSPQAGSRCYPLQD
jgi:hypothetical protein